MFARRIGLAVTRTGRRFLSEGVEPKSDGLINWNHPKLKTIGPFCCKRYGEYKKREMVERFIIRSVYGGMIGALIGGIIGYRDDRLDHVKTSPTDETLQGAFMGAITVGLAVGFYPVTIPLTGIIGVRKMTR